MPTFSDAMVKRLNEACVVLSQACDHSCDNIGWCDSCWIVATVKNGKRKKRNCKPKTC